MVRRRQRLSLYVPSLFVFCPLLWQGSCGELDGEIPVIGREIANLECRTAGSLSASRSNAPFRSSVLATLTVQYCYEKRALVASCSRPVV